MAELTCHTDGCPNAEIPIELDIINPETGEPMPAYCGPCGQPITDISTEAADD